MTKKPDAVYAYGVEGTALDGLGVFPTVFYEDNENDILAGAIPGRDEFGYFGYLKKMILTLHNIKSSASRLHKQNVNEKPIETSLLENIMAYR